MPSLEEDFAQVTYLWRKALTERDIALSCLKVQSEKLKETQSMYNLLLSKQSTVGVTQKVSSWSDESRK